MKTDQQLLKMDNRDFRQECGEQSDEFRNKQTEHLLFGKPCFRLTEAQLEKYRRGNPEAYAALPEKALQSKLGRWFAHSAVCSRMPLIVIQ